jgi:hypothetical protein
LPKIALCLPPNEALRPSLYPLLNGALQLLEQRQIPCRIIPEETLINDWEQLDDLIVASTTLSPQGKRKLQGFCSAGGRVITHGPLIGLPHEISIEAWRTERSPIP